MRTLEHALSDPTLLAKTDAFVDRARMTMRAPADAMDGVLTTSTPPADVANIEQRVRLDGVLGEGGMGVVRLGEQIALRRKVAVKGLREAQVDDRRAARKLLQEAWVTGSLEHPNIVPVHDLYIDEAGRPHLVLKKIEGRPWASVMADARGAPAKSDAPDSLESNLGIFIQVCHAIAFAHDRGIVHRDLKPDNVMIGEFGEVVVLDWGIALTTRNDDRHIPHVSTAREAAGTPAYMAPEMLGGSTSRIGVTTDVYLLGAILYEITEGIPPHDGASFDAVLRSIVTSRPVMSSTSPAELQRIIARAMDPDPDGRFENVRQLQMAVQAFLRNRGSERLCAAADERRDALVRGIAAVGLSSDPGEHARLHALFSECRFAYTEALRAWSGNEDAARGLRETTVCFVEHQLALHQPQVARASLAVLSDPPTDLRARVDAAIRAHEAQQSALTQLAAQHDSAIGTRTRATVALMMSALWTVVPWQLLRNGVPEMTVLLVCPLMFLLAGGLILWWAWDSLTKTAVNRFLSAVVAWTLAFQSLLAWTAQHLGVRQEHVLPMTFVLWAMAAAFVAQHQHRRLYAMVVCYLTGMAVALWMPELRWAAAFSCNIVGVLIAFALWAPRSPFSIHPAA